MSNLKIYTFPDNPRAAKALVTGKYVGVNIEVPAFNFGVDNRTPEFHQKNPNGKVPVLETPEGCIWESNAIARYVARLGNSIYGSNNLETSQIDQWIDFSVGEIDLPASAWLYPIMELVENNPTATSKAKGDIRKVLDILNKHLATRTFLVTERITLADIVVALSLHRLYTMVLDPNFRKAFPNTNRWFLTIVNQPNFKAVMGETKLAEKMAVAPPPKDKEKEETPKSAPKEEKPKPKPAPKPADEGDDDEEKAPPKAKNPLDELPPTKFDLDAWKRMYSNEKDTRGVAMKWFWENFDKDGWSLWISDYKYNEDLDKQLYKLNNFIGGFFQRLEKLHRYGFGSILIFNDEDKYQISGAWLLRGHQLPKEMTDCDDSELYNWTRVDLDNEAQKELLTDYWCWSGTFGNKHYPFNDNGKIYK